MVKICCVETCRAESVAGCGISFHRFPKNKETYKKWLKVVRGRISSTSVVCGLHFKPEDYVYPLSMKKYLNPNAVPSIFNVIKPIRPSSRPRAEYSGVNILDVKSFTSGPVKDERNIVYYERCDDDISGLQEFEDTSYTQNVAKCKCCLDSNSLRSMWWEHDSGERRDYGTLLIECFALPWRRPEDPESNSEQICASCIDRLKDAFSFKMEVLASEQLMRKQLEDEDLNKLNVEHDDEDTQFDVETEYLHYEYLEDNLEDVDNNTEGACGNDDGGHDDDIGAQDDDISAHVEDPLAHGCGDDSGDGCDELNEDDDKVKVKVETSMARDKKSRNYRRGKATLVLKRKRPQDATKAAVNTVDWSVSPSRKKTRASSNKSIGYLVMLRKNARESQSSSSSSDEEWNSILQNYIREKGSRGPRADGANDRYTDDEFKRHFRLSTSTFNYLHELVRDDLVRRVPGCPAIPSRCQLMVALWKMATIDSYRSVCNRFKVGRATAVRAVRRVCHALYKRAPLFIHWPKGERVMEIIREFERTTGFPKTIGAINGTHIRISAPKHNPADYMNRKGFHSIQLQLVCDHKSLITHCNVGQPGSVDDKTVFGLSEVANYLNDDEAFPENSHILGDFAYEIHQHLLTPYRDNGDLSEKQKKYNAGHAIARVTVEKCIGSLKGRMRSLLHCLPMTRVDLMSEYIVACCVIHNICILRDDELNVITIPEKDDNNEDNSPEVIENAGTVKRDVIMNSL